MAPLYFLAIVAGLVLPLQIAFNNKLTSYSGNPITSSLISFSVGTCALLIYSLSNHGTFQKSLQNIGQAPPYAWMGGLIGCFYIVTTLIASPKIGMAISLSLIIGGQLCMSLILDHNGWFGMEVKPFSWVKGAGLLLVIAGIFLLKK